MLLHTTNITGLRPGATGSSLPLPLAYRGVVGFKATGHQPLRFTTQLGGFVCICRQVESVKSL